MATSFLTFAGDGSTTDFLFDQGALEAGHLTATVDDVEVEVTITEQLVRREFLVSFAVAPALDSVIKVVRTTPVTQRVAHSSSAIFAKDTPDESFLHRLYILQEALDNFTDADSVTTEFKDQLQVLVDAMNTIVSDDQAVTSAAVDAALALYEANIQAALDEITPNVSAEDTLEAIQDEAAKQCNIETAYVQELKDGTDVINDTAQLETKFPYVLSGLSDYRYWPLNDYYDSTDGTMFGDYSGNDDHIWVHPDADGQPDFFDSVDGGMVAGQVNTEFGIDNSLPNFGEQYSAATDLIFQPTDGFTLVYKAQITSLNPGSVFYGPIVESNNTGSTTSLILPPGRFLRHAIVLQEVFTGQLDISIVSIKADGNSVSRTLSFNGLATDIPLDVIVAVEINSTTNRVIMTAEVNGVIRSLSAAQLSGFTDLEPGEFLGFGMATADVTVGAPPLNGFYGHILYTPDLGITNELRASYDPLVDSDVALGVPACTLANQLGAPVTPPDPLGVPAGGQIYDFGTPTTTTINGAVFTVSGDGTLADNPAGITVSSTPVDPASTTLAVDLTAHPVDLGATEWYFKVVVESVVVPGNFSITEYAHDGTNVYVYQVDQSGVTNDMSAPAPLTLNDILFSGIYQDNYNDAQNDVEELYRLTEFVVGDIYQALTKPLTP